jgi:translation initiation factor IF-2
MDTKRGISATIIIKNGTLKKGNFIVADGAMVGTRIVEDFAGKQISEATFSSPIRVTGFDEIPKVGATFKSFESKKEAEEIVREWKNNKIKDKDKVTTFSDTAKIVPIIIKTDVAGTGEAIEKEIAKLCTDEITCKFVSRGVGSIGENDIKLASGDKDSIIIGFNVKIDPKARDLNESLGVRIETFDIIYKISEWLKDELEKRRPKKVIAESTGKVKVLKNFSATKERQVIGGRVESGTISVGNSVKIIRRDFEIGRGTIVGLEQGKVKTREVSEVNECGILIESKFDVAPGDYLEPFNMIEK